MFLAKREARALWDGLRGKVSKGEKLPDRKVRFAPLAEEWFESKTKIRRSTRDLSRMALDVHILPRFGGWRVAALDAEAVAKFVRHLEAKGLSQSTIENYLLPLKGTSRPGRTPGRSSPSTPTGCSPPTSAGVRTDGGRDACPRMERTKEIKALLGVVRAEVARLSRRPAMTTRPCWKEPSASGFAWASCWGSIGATWISRGASFMSAASGLSTAS